MGRSSKLVKLIMISLINKILQTSITCVKLNVRTCLKGEYSIGSMIPPESKLQEIYQVSRHTVRQALSLLIQQGYLKAEKGSGTFVLNYKESHKSKKQSTKTIGVITTYLSITMPPMSVATIRISE